MSIQKITYKLCKSIQKSENRDPVKNLIQALSLNNDAIVFRQTVRHISTYPKLQFLAYLIVAEQNKEPEPHLKHGIPVLEDEEIRILVDCHEQLLKLNKLCVFPILEKVPQIELAVSPFNKFAYGIQKVECDFTLLDVDLVDELVKEFQNHPAIEVFNETKDKLTEEIKEEHYISDVINFAQEIIESSPFKSPEWLNDRKKVIENDHLRHMLALVSLRDSLSNINQLIFQATTEIDDKLLIFDDENIIDLSSIYNSEVSSSVRVISLTHPFKFTIAVEPLIFNSGTLVLLKEVYGYEGVQLGRVEGKNANLFADHAEFDIRLIDENLNSFPKLVN